MGQVALGFRSLLVKVAVFIVLAALLAWAMGGTLWPRPETAEFTGVDFAGRTWYWKLLVGGSDDEVARVRWQLMVTPNAGRTHPFNDRFYAAAVKEPVVAGTALYVGVQPVDAASWTIQQITGAGGVIEHPMPDRLAVQRQLARLAAGLPLQPREAILAERPRVLDPGAPNTSVGGE